MSQYRVKLDYVINVPDGSSTIGLHRIGDLICNGLVGVGITDGELLPGQKLSITSARPRSGAGRPKKRKPKARL